MEATLTELHRNTKTVVAPAISGKQKVVITDHGKPILEIVRHEEVETIPMAELRKYLTADAVVEALKASRA